MKIGSFYVFLVWSRKLTNNENNRKENNLLEIKKKKKYLNSSKIVFCGILRYYLLTTVKTKV